MVTGSNLVRTMLFFSFAKLTLFFIFFYFSLIFSIQFILSSIIFIMHLKNTKNIYFLQNHQKNVYLIFKIKIIIFACIFNLIAILSFESLLIAFKLSN